MRILLLAIILATAGASGAQEKRRTPLDEYQSQSTFHLTICRLQLMTAVMLASTGRELTEEERGKSDYRRCIADGQAALKSAYVTAAKTVKKPGAKSALKDHYVAASGALAGVAPAVSERQAAYDQRQGEAERRLQELWTRLELER